MPGSPSRVTMRGEPEHSPAEVDESRADSLKITTTFSREREMTAVLATARRFSP